MDTNWQYCLGGIYTLVALLDGIFKRAHRQRLKFKTRWREHHTGDRRVSTQNFITGRAPAGGTAEG